MSAEEISHEGPCSSLCKVSDEDLRAELDRRELRERLESRDPKVVEQQRRERELEKAAQAREGYAQRDARKRMHVYLTSKEAEREDDFDVFAYLAQRAADDGIRDISSVRREETSNDGVLYIVEERKGVYVPSVRTPEPFDELDLITDPKERTLAILQRGDPDHGRDRPDLTDPLSHYVHNRQETVEIVKSIVPLRVDPATRDTARDEIIARHEARVAANKV